EHAQIVDLDVWNFEFQDMKQHFDVVLSDMAPNTTGNRATDQYRSYELFARALEIAAIVLKPGGAFVGKLFQGPEFQAAKQRAQEIFETVQITRPKATRSESFEVFFVGKNRKTLTT